MTATWRPVFRQRGFVSGSSASNFSMIAFGAAQFQQLDAARPVRHIDDGLRGHRADARFSPEHAVADGKHALLHSGAHFARLRVVTQNRKRPGRIEIRLLRARRHRGHRRDQRRHDHQFPRSSHAGLLRHAELTPTGAHSASAHNLCRVVTV